MIDKFKFYDNFFYSVNNYLGRNSAPHIIEIINHHFSIESVLDVGCGYGAWLNCWKKYGINDICGIDGPHINSDQLIIDNDLYKSINLEEGFDLDRMFSLVQCLEVGEHIHEKYSYELIKSLIKHSKLILFSAAQPGQGGYNHINEKNINWWKTIFNNEGYYALDLIRPVINKNNNVANFYKYNTVVYLHDSFVSGLNNIVKNSVVENDKELIDCSPVIYKFRKYVLRLFHFKIFNIIAKIKIGFQYILLRK